MKHVLEDAGRQQLATVHTSMPGRVLRYDASTQLADIQITVQFSRRGADGERIPYTPAPLPNVPILWGTGGDYSDTWPLEPGDEVWVLFAERSIDEWLVTGHDVVTPSSVRRFSLSDAVALPVKSSRRTVLPADAVADARVIRAPEIRLGSASATAPVALAPSVASELGGIAATLAALEAWATTVGAELPTPVPYTPVPYSPGEVAATRVKAE